MRLQSSPPLCSSALGPGNSKDPGLDKIVAVMWTGPSQLELQRLTVSPADFVVARGQRKAFTHRMFFSLLLFFIFCFMRVIRMSINFFELLMNHKRFHTEHKYHTSEKRPCYFSTQSRFFWAFALQTKATNHDSCAEQTSRLSPTVEQTFTWPAPSLFLKEFQALSDQKTLVIENYIISNKTNVLTRWITTVATCQVLFFCDYHM